MRRRFNRVILVCLLIALALTLVIWPLSYRVVVGHTWTTGSFLLEGKENVDSRFGISASHGTLRVEQYVTRTPASEPVDYGTAARLQTTRIAVPLWCVAIFWGVVSIAALRFQVMIRKN